MAMADLVSIHERITQAAMAAGRTPGSVELIAVSKQQPRDRVEVVLQSGHRVFGENRVQEAAMRWPPLNPHYGHVHLHLIGPLQTNKVRQAMDLFQTIHSLDRPKLAHRLADLAQEYGKCPDLFIQINTGEEPQKTGILPNDADDFVKETRKMNLPVLGLMCIPPIHEEASLHFALLAKIAKRNGLAKLSMGMSADFETAIAFGATHVRVGSAIFGSRGMQDAPTSPRENSA